MKYCNDVTIELGDRVTVNIPDGDFPARVVMLGDSYDHLDLEEGFMAWVVNERILRCSSVVVEWVGKNPFEHSSAAFSPVEDYMFTDIDEGVTFRARGE